jgi:hypothetical protein
MTQKNKAAVELGRRGGTARAAKLSPERRKEIATKASHSRKNWPEKLHTFKCGVEGCRITTKHDHV